MSDAVHGKVAKVKNGANTIAHLNKWTMKLARDTKEQTAFGDSALPFRSWVAGLVGADVNFEGHFDSTDTTGHVALLSSMTSDTPLTIDLYITATKYFEVSCFVTSADLEGAIDDLEPAKYGLKVTGAGATSLLP